RPQGLELRLERSGGQRGQPFGEGAPTLQRLDLPLRPLQALLGQAIEPFGELQGLQDLDLLVLQAGLGRAGRGQRRLETGTFGTVGRRGAQREARQEAAQEERRTDAAHTRRNLRTASMLPSSPNVAPPASSSSPSRQGTSSTSCAPASRKPRRVATRGAARCEKSSKRPNASAPPSSPWSSPSMMNGTRTNRSVAPTSFWISISSRRA